MADQEPVKEGKEDYTMTRIAFSFNIRQETALQKFKKSFEQEENKLVFDRLMKDENNVLAIFAIQSSAEAVQLFQEVPHPDKFKKKGLVILKIQEAQLTAHNVVQNLLFLELTRNILEHLYNVYYEILGPVLQNPQNQQGWTDLVAKDLMEKFNSYVAQVYVMIGQIDGRTKLPLPSHKLTVSDNTPAKDKAHVFESSIITWTKQIKNVLKLEPEQALKNGQNPGPLVELKFWENKAVNLNSIKQQLEGPQVTTILRFLESNKSTYTNPFSKLMKEVDRARNEANDNTRFLELLKDPFQRLCDTGGDFIMLHELFIPIMHGILLIWKHSKHYNTPPRLVVLIREICNAIIAKAQEFVSGGMIFQMISSEETQEACDKLQNTIDVCTKFKDAYFEYKAKADGQWKLTTNALFVRLDSFLERCHDILHLTNTILQFNKLAKIELGGTKGKTLTESVQQIFTEFQKAVETFQQVKYDIMDINQKDFDENFYEFRSKIKELERRLASVITQGFDDYDTLHGRFKLLDSFEGLLSRPIIQDELEKKHIVLLDMYKQDLKSVQQIFLDGYELVDKQSDKAPLYNNMPPIAGALAWCRGLRDRIAEPLDKLANLGQGITEREEYKDVVKLYQSIKKQIEDYEETKILNWEQEVGRVSEEKQKQPLLAKVDEGFLKVNFDPALVRLLREVKYFTQLEREVPPEAKQLFEKNDTFREQIVLLEMVVANHNYIIKEILPTEEPLIKSRIEKMDEVLRPGIEHYKWKSPDISKFIETAKATVDDLYQIVQKMQDTRKKIQGALDLFNQKIIDKKNKPMAPDDYDQFQKAVTQNKLAIVKDKGTTINKLVKEVLDHLKIDKKTPAWINYQYYLNSIVIDGISRAIITALGHLNDLIDPIKIKKNDTCPLFDIKLELSRNIGIQYEPEIEENNQGNSVRNTIRSWINDMFFIAGQFQRLDSANPQSDYLPEIRGYFEIKEVVMNINVNLELIERETQQFKQQYQVYSYLWTEDPKQSFEDFLNKNEPPKDPAGQEDEEAQNPLLQGCRYKIPSLDLFDDKITHLKTIQQEISRIQTPYEIYWLKINLQPFKSSLENKVSGCIKVYTEFLVIQFKTTLKNLKNFIQRTNEGIKENPAMEEHAGNRDLLMKVMRVISDVKDVEHKCEGIVQRMKEMVNKLKKHGVQIMEKGEDDPIQSIDNAFTQFNETTQRVFKIKAEILPLQTQETVQIKKRLDEFSKKVNEFRLETTNNLPYAYYDDMTIDQIQNSYNKIDEYYKKLLAIEKEASDYNQLEKLFELEKSGYKQLRDCSVDLKSLKTMWDAISLVNFQYNDWKSKPFRQIKADLLLESNKLLANSLKNLSREIKNFKGYNAIVDKVKNMSVVLPLVSSLHSEFMEDRHWKQVKEMTRSQFDQKSMTFTFEDILGLQLYKFEAHINETVEVAQKEAKIEKKLKLIEQAWNKQLFEFEDYKETKIFLPLDNMMEMLDQHSLDLMGMKGQGKYVEFFYDTVEDWREKLGRVDSVVQEWLKVQKNWRTLVNIFIGSEDIRTQLPEDTKTFEAVDKEFREIMIDVSTNPLVIEACINERKEQLVTMSASIKRCEKALNDYLEQKKKAFPRFYFLSNQSLLTILSNGQNPPKVAEFLGDCFDGMKTLRFEQPRNPNEVARTGNAMISKDDELVEFSTNFECTGAVENWLANLEDKMRETLEEILGGAKQTSESWEGGDKPREEWVKDYCAQIALLTTQIVWTEDVTRAFEDLAGGAETAMKECLKLIETRIDNLIRKVRGDLFILERMKIINIITIDVHSRDVVDKFVMWKTQELESFAWLSQLKFYWDNKDSDMHLRQQLRWKWEKEKDKSKCIIRIVDWFRFYSYEYVGNALRLVITPLTDRCYITLTQALNLTMGGAPAGPAGTGKTETTKDLGRAVGLPVMVFNCSDQMGKDSMAQIFMGLSQSGAWGCFDEFNRIAIEVLSVISTQVKTVLDALKEKKTKFIFMEEGEIGLKDSVGFFITMNPGYAGRTELPENLKALFRSCAMVVPDLVLICENMLMSEGFQMAKQLSRKFVSLYMLSRELLSKARHYDWGLRAVKSVLRMAGKLKRADPQIQEDPLLMRALRDFNMPKIVTDDKPIFLRLISDLFPKIDCPQKTDPDFKKVVTDTTKVDMGFIAEELFVMKVVQLAEILEVRHCCFVIGPPGCGKTAVWKTLARTHCNKGEECEYDTLNPKAVTSDELFGCYSKTKEWKNGVLSMIMKNQNKCEEKYKQTHQHKWSILDGDIDPEWIESLNTVMDDNKVLTLVSNDRIPLTPSMRLLLEISNLKNATPATVSRGGVLFINETDIGWMPYMNSWLERSFEKSLVKREGLLGGVPVSPYLSDVAKSVFYRCFQQYFETNQDIRDKTKVRLIVPMVDIAQVSTICMILDALLLENEAFLTSAADKQTLKEDDFKVIFEAFFIFAGMWAIGGCFGGGQDDEKDMKDFNSIWKAAAKIRMPDQGMCFDYYFDPVEQKWTHWQNKVQAYIATDEQIFSKIYVATLHTTRLRTLLEYHQKRRKPVLFVGSAGTGKSAVIKDYLGQTKSEQVAYKTINFSSFTDSLALQKNIESMVEKKSGKTFGSATGKVLICFIDDLNMPYVDKYGTQQPIQLLRQIVDYGSIFNREQLEERKFLQDILFFSALNQKSGSFTVDLRLQRNFSVFTMYTPTPEIIKTIFGAILNSHLAAFDDKIFKMSDKIIEATIHVFQKILRDTRYSPSARKFHYQFNYRELAKVVEGMMRSTPNAFRGQPNKILKLWAHECKRVFEDRFINEEDIKVFRDYLKDALVKNIGEPDEKENPLEEPSVFTSFVSVHTGAEPSYQYCDPQTLKKVLDEKLKEYNEVKAMMNLVLFQQAMEHICRIARILELPGGNSLLVGVGGSGKQSLTRLASFIIGFETDQMVVTSNFSINDLRNYLQEIYKKIAKPSAQPRCFLLTDAQIKEETFLIPINDMLNSGWIFDLFPKEDYDNMVSGLRNEAKGAGIIDNLDSITQYFLDKMRKNLHVVLCFSPVGDTMRIRSRKFPGIINSTSVDWFHPWPKDALIDVSYRFIQEIKLETDDLRKIIALHMAEVHISIDYANQKYLKLERRYNYTTPKSFLELIDFYKKLLKEQQEKITKQIQRYEQGLNILAETQSKVQILQAELKIKMVEVDKKSRETDVLIEKVGRESSIAEDEQKIANEEEEKTNVASKEAEDLSNNAEKELAKALPALKQAKDAVDCLTKGHITEMKSLGSPPGGVLLVARVILILLGEKITLNDAEEKVWKKAQQIMNNPQKFLDTVKDFNGKNIDPLALNPVMLVLNDPSKNFNEKYMLGQNMAASKLAAWAINITTFNRIFLEVDPLEKKRDAAQAKLEEKKKELAIVKAKVAALNEKVAILRRELEAAEKQKQIVEADANACKEKLNAAEKLVNGLAGENKRWGENVKELSQNIKSVIGNALLAAAFVSYIGAFSAKIRLELWSKIWLVDLQAKQIPLTQGIEPLKILTSDAKVAAWKNEGLPADQMSLENASVISACSRWPLIIDPQLQGSTWIRGSQGDNLVTVNVSQNKWQQLLNQAIPLGKVVLLEGIQQEIDATLDPLLSRAIIKKGKSQYLEIGGETIDYDPKFKLFLMTKLFNPHFRPEIAAQCTIINFIVTESGLEEQLLADVVNIERNELEMKRSELVKQQNEFSVQLDKLEEGLLISLSEADPATILDNVELIRNLDNTKQTSNQISEQSAIAKITEAEINQQRELYRIVAAEGAMLYFLVIQLSVMEHMYQYSLESFKKFFFKAIERTTVKDETRTEELRKNIRYTIYQWISRGLFERHKLIFLTLITFRLMQKKVIEVVYEPAEMDFLIKCVPRTGVADNNLDWLPGNAWDQVQGMIQLEEFKLFAQNMEKDAPIRFKDWYNELAPEEVKLPFDWKRLDQMPFKKLLVLRCLRPDRMTVAMTSFIRGALPQGESFVEMDSKLNFSEILSGSVDDSDAQIPIFFILSPGADPVKEVEKLAKSYKIEPGKNFWNISLGQGQDEIARRRIEEGNKEGHWVMLQNIHLMPRWLLELEKILDSFTGESGGGNPKFRLFLSAEPSSGIPIGLLDRSIKLTNEPPAGLRANMKRAWAYFSKDEIEDKDVKIKSILFGLCFFHSTVIERRRFGPKGWNMSYPFSVGDLRDSYLVMNRYIEQNASGKPPFDDLKYIFGEIMYGGHIVDDWDRRLCMAYLDNIMHEGIFDELELFPFIEGKNLSFKVPPASNYEKYIEHIEQVLTQETPLAYGLHSNAEIGFRTTQCNNLFATLLELQPKDSSQEEGAGGAKTKNELVQDQIKYLQEEVNLKSMIFNQDEIKNKMEADNKTPYQNVFLQEIEYMNILLVEIVRTLEEIDQGFRGILTISEKMEQVIDNIALNRVPPYWVALAYPSKRGLSSWLLNLVKRIEQLNLFRDDPYNIPKVTMIGRFFNPQSFLTAIKQVIGRARSQELNKLYIATEVTKKTIEEIEGQAKEGAFVFGFVLEGARWDIQIGQLDESRPKEMFFVLPVVYCKALVVPMEGKEDKSLYQCPCYRTEDRGSTFIFTAQLKTRLNPRKWILAGVGLLLDVEGVSDEAAQPKKEKKA